MEYNAVGHGKAPCLPCSPRVTGNCWWELVRADPLFPGSIKWELWSYVLPLCIGARGFPICSMHMLYGLQPVGAGMHLRALLAKKPLSPLNSVT